MSGEVLHDGAAAPLSEQAVRERFRRMNVHIGRARKAFSLIELMIVIVIMAVLAAIVIPRFADHSRRGTEGGLKHDLSQLRTALATFQADTDYYPKLLSDLAATTAPGQGYDSSGSLRNIDPLTWHGPYVGSVPYDPITGTSFVYAVTAPGVGAVTSSSTGNDLTGVAFSTY